MISKSFYSKFNTAKDVRTKNVIKGCCTSCEKLSSHKIFPKQFFEGGKYLQGMCKLVSAVFSRRKFSRGFIGSKIQLELTERNIFSTREYSFPQHTLQKCASYIHTNRHIIFHYSYILLARLIFNRSYVMFFMIFLSTSRFNAC